MEQKSLDMFEVVRILSASRWLIIGIVLVVAIAAVAYSLSYSDFANLSTTGWITISSKLRLIRN